MKSPFKLSMLIILLLSANSSLQARNCYHMNDSQSNPSTTTPSDQLSTDDTYQSDQSTIDDTTPTSQTPTGLTYKSTTDELKSFTDADFVVINANNWGYNNQSPFTPFSKADLKHFESKTFASTSFLTGDQVKEMLSQQVANRANLYASSNLTFYTNEKQSGPNKASRITLNGSPLVGSKYYKVTHNFSTQGSEAIDNISNEFKLKMINALREDNVTQHNIIKGKYWSKH